MRKESITGGYNTKITLMFPSGTSIKDGVEVTNYVPGASLMAQFDVKPPRGRTIFIGQADHTVSTRWIKVRYISGVEADWHVRCGTVEYEIASEPIDHEMRHRELYLELKAVN